MRLNLKVFIKSQYTKMEFGSDGSEEIRPQRFSAGFTLLTAYYVTSDAQWLPV